MAIEYAEDGVAAIACDDDADAVGQHGARDLHAHATGAADDQQLLTLELIAHLEILSVGPPVGGG
ncbi:MULTISPECIES: hypothetical protein [Acidithiobacillus]|uniref:hypothetical protein n=1 Tax=Acidithiobacillus TaxID=119977 RepID=UPI001CDBC468|nr:MULTISPECIES: hypothetical protein [Acidithiobacillus]MCR0968861.1 hypothetical protein [Acidithiobacillus ferrooxidans]MCR1342689.1 hypothetical protein [Acidithiobacillus ferrooxidans]MCR1347201.1 hypothetical protein [Acidithiobacillus ferrooxidans]MCR1349142.1 hypothetical protein [Acidithiobacillus ferrooxidans]MCR1350722.1 hypothetical protein [Acidithiobacillus ferrooxidans]